jgi:hypothetical protein
MNTQGFYKKDGESIIFSNNTVQGPDYLLVKEDHLSYVFPIDGWIWAEDLTDAISQLSAIEDQKDFNPFLTPYGYYLATSPYDENEFTKLITLIQISIPKGILTNNSLVTIKDKDGISRNIKVDDFLDLMVEYGFYCYQIRNFS